MISALEANKRSNQKISEGALKQLEEIEKQILSQINSVDIDYASRGYCYYHTDLLKAEVRVLLNKLGYKVTGAGSTYDHKHSYLIDWQAAGQPKYPDNRIYWRNLLNGV